VTELVRTVAPLERFTPELAEALGIQDAPGLVAALDRRGLFLEPRGMPGWYALSPMVREFVLQRLPLDPGRRRALCRDAATWLEDRGLDDQALALLMAADETEAAARVLVLAGAGLLAAGAAELVVRVANWLPATVASRRSTGSPGGHQVWRMGPRPRAVRPPYGTGRGRRRALPGGPA
jgi:ATP/maltotriose-dependent transcriptional regulator MalT